MRRVEDAHREGGRLYHASEHGNFRVSSIVYSFSMSVVHAGLKPLRQSFFCEGLEVGANRHDSAYTYEYPKSIPSERVIRHRGSTLRL